MDYNGKVKYAIGQLIYYEDEKVFGTVVGYGMGSDFADESPTLRYKIEWSDGWKDGLDNLYAEDLIDEYVGLLNRKLKE